MLIAWNVTSDMPCQLVSYEFLVGCPVEQCSHVLGSMQFYGAICHGHFQIWVSVVLLYLMFSIWCYGDAVNSQHIGVSLWVLGLCNLQIERRKISVVNPTLHNSQISRVLGQRWRKLTDADRQPFIREAVRLRAKHGRDHPNYKFQPRRKSKRRTGFRQPLTVRQPTDRMLADVTSKQHREATGQSEPSCLYNLGSSVFN